MSRSRSWKTIVSRPRRRATRHGQPLRSARPCSTSRATHPARSETSAGAPLSPRPSDIDIAMRATPIGVEAERRASGRRDVARPRRVEQVVEELRTQRALVGTHGVAREVDHAEQARGRADDAAGQLLGGAARRRGDGEPVAAPRRRRPPGRRRRTSARRRTPPRGSAERSSRQIESGGASPIDARDATVAPVQSTETRSGEPSRRTSACSGASSSIASVSTFSIAMVRFRSLEVARRERAVDVADDVAERHLDRHREDREVAARGLVQQGGAAASVDHLEREADGRQARARRPPRRAPAAPRRRRAAGSPSSAAPSSVSSQRVGFGTSTACAPATGRLRCSCEPTTSSRLKSGWRRHVAEDEGHAREPTARAVVRSTRVGARAFRFPPLPSTRTRRQSHGPRSPPCPRGRREMPSLRVAVDVGGTFTDIFVFDESTAPRDVAKVPSTPARPDGGRDGRRRAPPASTCATSPCSPTARRSPRTR